MKEKRKEKNEKMKEKMKEKMNERVILPSHSFLIFSSSFIFFFHLLAPLFNPVRYVGAFMVVLVGARTVLSLWQALVDMGTSMRAWCAQLAVRVATLIALPVAIYLAFFYIHFQVPFILFSK